MMETISVLVAAVVGLVSIIGVMFTVSSSRSKSQQSKLDYNEARVLELAALLERRLTDEAARVERASVERLASIRREIGFMVEIVELRARLALAEKKT